MTAANYRQSLSLMLAHEGGFVNHPKDPGGATNQGVTQRVYDAYRKSRGATLRSVKFIEPNEVADIYKNQYWKLVRGDSLPAGLDYAVFDFGVNSGVSRAVKYLQIALGFTGSDVDGVPGMMTLNAANDAARADEEGLIIKYCANRMAFLKSLGTFPTFGKGWTRRVIGYTPGVQENDTGVIDYAIMMARKDDIYAMPSVIGTKPDEIPGKAIAPPEAVDLFPVIAAGDLVGIMSQNDMLAKKIALAGHG